MKAGLVGPSYQMKSLPFDAQRSVGLYPVRSETGNSKEIAAMYGTPGLDLFATLGQGPTRGFLTCGNGRTFTVARNKFYEINADGSSTERGTLSTYTGLVSMEENGFQVMIATGTDGYIFDFADNQELVTNGTFDADSNWTKDGNTTIAAGVATIASADTGTALTQTILAFQYVTYQVTYTITRAAGTIKPNLFGTDGTARNADGTYTETIIAGSGTDISFKTAGFTGTIDNISVKQVTDQFIHITAAGFPGADFVTFKDSRFIINHPDSGQFNISGQYNGLQWDPLNFATAESSPDDLVAPYAFGDQLFLFGSLTTEPWYDSGDVDFPFAKVPGVKMEVGLAARFTLARGDNTVFWVGGDRLGSGIVYRAQGATPMRISTEWVELKLRESGDLSQLVGFCYQQEGHTFYLITGGNLQTTLVCDVKTQQWHERAYWNNGAFEPWRGVFHCFAFGKNLTGDRADGKIYAINPDSYTDNGDAIRRVRTFAHIGNEGKPFKINYLQVDFETGVGLQGNGQGSDPLVYLRFSKDGGKTWSEYYSARIGKVGENPRVIWRRLGTFKGLVTFEVSTSEPVPIRICGAYFG